MTENVIVMMSKRPISDRTIAARLKRMASILTAIEAGELLSALPACPLAQRDHAAALDLLVTLSDELETLRRALAASDAALVRDEQGHAPVA